MVMYYELFEGEDIVFENNRVKFGQTISDKNSDQILKIRSTKSPYSIGPYDGAVVKNNYIGLK